VKSAIFPVHTWLPDAHSAAPSGVSAMLSGIVIEVELFALIKILVSIFYNRVSSPFDHIITLFLLIIAALTMTIPNLTALVQEDIKRMLAYSSVYNMGLMLVGVAIGTPLALAATIFHILNHGIAKATIFICAGSFIKEGNTREIKKLMGIGTIMKVAAITFSISALFLAAFPPLAMFWSKLFLINATVESSQEIGWMGIIIAILIVVNSVISIGYYYGILLQKLVIIPENQISENVREASEKSKTIILSEVILLAIMLVVSIFSLYIFDIICHSVNSFLSIYR
jgi:multicomponent Na+:H+ antiporter subunit D